MYRIRAAWRAARGACGRVAPGELIFGPDCFVRNALSATYLLFSFRILTSRSRMAIHVVLNLVLYYTVSLGKLPIKIYLFYLQNLQMNSNDARCYLLNTDIRSENQLQVS